MGDRLKYVQIGQVNLPMGEVCGMVEACSWHVHVHVEPCTYALVPQV